MNMKHLKLTTVKVFKEMYERDFKIEAIKNGINFQKLVNRSILLYIKNEPFKQMINECDDLVVSGSF